MKTMIPSSGQLSRAGLPAGPFESLLERGKSFLTRLTRWVELSRQRHALGELSDHMLKDLGLSRADVESELRKPFWRE